MPRVQFYLDDSGTRHPNRKPGKTAAHKHDWFALGGILVNEEDEPKARLLHKEFCEEWKIASPLHSVEIRSRRGKFAWIEDLNQRERDAFYEALYQLLRKAPVIGLACVVDRPGYNARYSEMYGRQPWSLCKTAFVVAVERAAKHARKLGRSLRVMPERCNKVEDDLLAGYYKGLVANGMPFPGADATKYGALAPEDFRETLYEFRLKAKTSPMAQFADLFLWPLCMGGYDPNNRPYRRLIDDGKVIDCGLSDEERPLMGVKYSCFDAQKKT